MRRKEKRGRINERKKGKVYEYFLKERKLITKEKELLNQDLEQKLKLMNMDIEPMKNIKMEE